MNVAVINLKQISKNLVRITAIIIFLIVITKFLIANNSILQKIFTFERCSSIYTSFFNNGNEIKDKTDYIDILQAFCPIVIAANHEKPDVVNKETIKENNTQNSTSVVISKNADIQNVFERNLQESYNITYKTVKVRNQSDYNLTEDILNPEELTITNSNKILIYHTHTCESYTPSEKSNYTMTGNYRTTDNNYNVVKVGEELKKYLTAKGFSVIHNNTYNDYPSYSGSYERSLDNIQGDLIENQDMQIVIDLHRDAVGDGASYGPTVKINGESVAQMMFVIGTDGGGLEHPNWQQNLKMAIKIQEKANEIYPGLFRPIIVRNSRYNQHVRTGAFIIEVGATGNTLEEAMLSMQCLANVLEETF